MEIVDANIMLRLSLFSADAGMNRGETKVLGLERQNDYATKRKHEIAQ